MKSKLALATIASHPEGYLTPHLESLIDDNTPAIYRCPICGQLLDQDDELFFSCKAFCFIHANVLDIIGIKEGIRTLPEQLERAAAIYGIELDDDPADLEWDSNNLIKTIRELNERNASEGGGQANRFRKPCRIFFVPCTIENEERDKWKLFQMALRLIERGFAVRIEPFDKIKYWQTMIDKRGKDDNETSRLAWAIVNRQLHANPATTYTYIDELPGDHEKWTCTTLTPLQCLGVTEPEESDGDPLRPDSPNRL